MKRDTLLIVRDLLIITFLLGIGLMVWRPDLRRQVLGRIPPGVKESGEGLKERVSGWIGKFSWGRKESDLARPESQLAEEPRPQAAAPVESDPPDRRAHELPEPAPPAAQPDAQAEEPDSSLEEPVVPSGNLPPRLPKLGRDLALPPNLRVLKTAADARPSAYRWRKLADAAAAGFPSIAADAYLKEAAIYRRQGDTNAAAVETLKAGRYRAEGALYLHVADAAEASSELARLEPPEGALLGAFIDRDERLPTTFLDENWQTHRDANEFGELVGKKHASVFCYLLYGKPFPTRWAARLKSQRVIPHIAWEPKSLADVSENAYLNRFAADVARLDYPVFIRFAGEMNGDWTPYHRDPDLYRQKFRLVHRVIAKRAPKAAMIWCVNNIPDGNIDRYYPGDDATDWVGVNFYNVLYFDNLRSRPADRVHPADLLQNVYSRYSARKPIAICEYAASHQAAIDPRPRPEYAVTRLAQLYGALPRRFPRVKLIDWFDCNNLKHARPERQLNNYSVTDDAAILRAYSQAVAPDYFLSSLDEQPSESIRALRSGDTVSGVVTVSAWVRCHLDRPRVFLLADDQVLYAGDAPGAALCRWDTRNEIPGTHTLRLLVLDGHNRKILGEKRTVSVQ